MINNAKQCPYCGEDIQAEAKKCRHCGEWLPCNGKTDETEKVDKAGKIEVNWLENPVADFIPFLFWIGVITAFISMSYSCGADSYTNPRKWTQLMQWATYVPEWLSDLLSGVVDVTMAYALYAGMKRLARPMSGLLMCNIIMEVLLSISIVLMDTMGSGGGSLGMIIFSVLGTLVVNTLIGIQMIRHFSGRLHLLGWGMFVSCIFLLLSAMLVAENETDIGYTIIAIASFGCTCFLLYIQKGLLEAD